MIFFTVANQRIKRGEIQFSSQRGFNGDAEANIPMAESAKTIARFFVGTCGYSYPGDPPNGWGGVFYPKGGGKRMDELTFYATYFDSVEIHSSFYRPPSAEMVQGWKKRRRLILSSPSKLGRNLLMQKDSEKAPRSPPIPGRASIIQMWSVLPRVFSR
jgi:hypothetical protein